MTIFSLLESFFFLFLGISFILVLLMVYHFKKKMDTIEKKNETLQDICKTICEELDFVKSQSQVQSQPVKPPNIDPYYLNYHEVHDHTNKNINNPTEFLPNVSDFFKTILVSGGGNSIPDALDIHNYENEELDDVHSYEEEDFEYQDSDTTNSTVEEVNHFDEKELESFEEIRVHVQKLNEFDGPTYDTYVDSETRVVEIEDDMIEGGKTEEVQEEEKAEEIQGEMHLEESLDTDDTESKFTSSKACLQKLTLQMLRTMVIKEGLCTDPSKMKKVELIQMVLDSQ